jgi:hypothetical protein
LQFEQKKRSFLSKNGSLSRFWRLARPLHNIGGKKKKEEKVSEKRLVLRLYRINQRLNNRNK